MLILVDPQVDECRRDERQSDKTERHTTGMYKNHRYQYGYIDFTPWAEALKAITAGEPPPSRICAYADIYDYLLHWVPDPEAPVPIQQVPALIVKKMALSHLMALIEYWKSLLSVVEYRLRKNRGGIQNLRMLEPTLTELFSWNLRLSQYCEYTEAALYGLRILPNPDIDALTGKDRWSTCDEDFRYVHQRMLTMKKRTNELISSVNGLIAIVEAKRALSQARTLTMLTIIGVLFLPLGFTSALFSMGQNYGPGQSQFWVYWVVAVPLVCLAFIGLHSAGGLNWERAKG